MSDARSFYECLVAAKGSTIKARAIYMRDRGWRNSGVGHVRGDEWYVAWEQGDLPREVVAACRRWNSENGVL